MGLRQNGKYRGGKRGWGRNHSELKKEGRKDERASDQQKRDRVWWSFQENSGGKGKGPKEAVKTHDHKWAFELAGLRWVKDTWGA